MTTDNPTQESRTRYALGVCVSVLVTDAIAFSLAALACLLPGAGLTLDNFCIALFVFGISMAAVGWSTGVSGIEARGTEPHTYVEVKVVPKGRVLLFSNLSLVIGGLIAILASIVLPLTLWPK